eukprot:402510-Amphidinium_carterae.1
MQATGSSEPATFGCTAVLYKTIKSFDHVAELQQIAPKFLTLWLSSSGSPTTSDKIIVTTCQYRHD